MLFRERLRAIAKLFKSIAPDEKGKLRFQLAMLGRLDLQNAQPTRVISLCFKSLFDLIDDAVYRDAGFVDLERLDLLLHQVRLSRRRLLGALDQIAQYGAH